MSSKRTPWSGSRRGDDFSAERFGRLDPRVIAAARRGSSGHRNNEPEYAGAATDFTSDMRGTVGAIGASLGERPGAGGRAVPSGTVGPPPAGHSYRDGGVGPAYWGGHALLGLVLGIAVLLTAGGFCLGRATDPHAAVEPVVTTFVAATPQVGATEPPPAVVSPRPEPVKPASPEVGIGFVFGKVRANDGGVLTVSSEITQSEVVVYSDSSTNVYVLIASDPVGIDIGAPVWIYGRKHADGSITARTIAGISMHGNTK